MDALISSSTGKTLSLQIPLRTLHAGEKRKLAFKYLLGCWLAAGISTIIMLVHFVAVPAFFIAGIVMFYRKLNQPTHVMPFSFKCLECGSDVKVAERVLTPEWEQVCPKCLFALKIEAQGSLPEASKA